MQKLFLFVFLCAFSTALCSPVLPCVDGPCDTSSTTTEEPLTTSSTSVVTRITTATKFVSTLVTRALSSRRSSTVTAKVTSTEEQTVLVVTTTIISNKTTTTVLESTPMDDQPSSPSPAKEISSPRVAMIAVPITSIIVVLSVLGLLLYKRKFCFRFNLEDPMRRVLEVEMIENVEDTLFCREHQC
jgi:hypothetical protein